MWIECCGFVFHVLHSAEVEHIKQIVDFFFDNSRPCRDMSKSPCRFQLKGLNTIRGDVLYLDVNKDDD